MASKIKLKKLKGSIILSIVLLIVASVISFSVENYTVPVQNDMSLAQVNGDDVDWAAMRTANSGIMKIRSIIWPMTTVLFIIIWGKWIYINKKELTKLSN